ncbi:MAG: 4-hydroxybenzoate decarboxylase subunit C [Chlamydiae bacterium]|nr:4-hydroxybenzoate decarboxylase subunit C [Chlamydiota bacterium]
MKNLRLFLQALRRAGEIVDIYEEVDPHLELAEVHRRVAAVDGPALFFHRVKGSSFPVVTNLFGSLKRVKLAFPSEPEKLIANLVKLATEEFPPTLSTLWKNRKTLRSSLHIGTKRGKKAPILDKVASPPDLEALPMLKTWPLDGGHFLTLPLVYTQPPGGGAPNLGMYRVQRYDKTTAGLHFQIQKGGGFHYHQAEKRGEPLPVTIFLGGPPALILSAILPLPENVPELLMAGLLQGGKLSVTPSSHSPYPLIGECEFALVGESPPHLRRPEGPFGDHYGYYSWRHDFPVFHCKALYHRKDAIYPATVVGKPIQEDFYIGEYLQELLSPIFPVVMPGVKDLWSYGETGFHSLSAAVVEERFYRECMRSAFRILGEGQLSLTKFLLLTDQPVDLKNFPNLLTTILERFRPETDLFIFSNLSLDTLDYTGPELNKGSRGVLLGVGEKIRDLPDEYTEKLPPLCQKVGVFSPGCLVVEGEPYTKNQDFSPLLSHPGLEKWPLILYVDSIDKTLQSTATFLWTVFTRFDPASDLYAKNTEILHHHLSYSPPILIDARMKPSYPQEVLCDPETAALVDRRWDSYFPQGMEMGDSLAAHVC